METLGAQFDILALHFDLLENRGHAESGLGDRQSPDTRDTRLTGGLRIVLETEGRVEPATFLRDVRDALSPIDDFELYPLFEDVDDLHPPAGAPDLATLWLLQLPWVSHSEFGRGRFDFSYYLRDCLRLKSAEPDLPFMGFEASEDLDQDDRRPRDRAWHLRIMNAKQAWDYSGQRGAGICIGHPDTGYAEHIDLDPARIRPKLGFDFVDMKPDPADMFDGTGSAAHGTATGSVIMSGGTIVSPPVSGEGGTGAPGAITGLAPEAELIPVRAAPHMRSIHSSRIAQAIYHCRRRGCGVIAIGMGGYPSRALHQAVADAVRHHVIVIAAAGNRVGSHDGVVWPARYRDCIAVAASNDRDEPWPLNCRGPQVDIAAPGQGVWRAIRRRKESCRLEAGPGSGTSYAASNAAGAAALWLGHHGRDKLVRLAEDRGTDVPSLFRQALKDSARRPDHWDSSLFGSGIVDLHRLLKAKPAPAHRYPGHCAVSRRRHSGTLQQAFGSRGSAEFSAFISSLLGAAATSDLFAWEQELISIVLQLECNGSPALEKLKSDSLLETQDRADIVSAIIRPLASSALSHQLERSRTPTPNGLT